MILIHRPLLSERPSLQISAEVAQAALNTCAASAEEITQILQLYAARYRPTSSTFSLSYAAYISAQVHVRALAKSHSPASIRSLKFCLDTLDQHEIIYSASKRANAIIRHLIGRSGISGIGSDTTAPLADATAAAGTSVELGDKRGPYDSSATRMTLQCHVDADTTSASQALMDFNPQAMVEGDSQWLSQLLDGPIFHDIYTNDRMMMYGSLFDSGDMA